MDNVGLAGVGMAGIAMIGTIVNSIMGFLTTRDKQRNDVKLALLEVSQKQCLEDHKECKDETAKLHEKLEVATKDRNELHVRITDLESKTVKV